MRTLYLSILTLLLFACDQPVPTAQAIVDEAIKRAGGERYEHCEIQFDFREHSYKIKRDGGLYEFTRITYLSPDSVLKDVMQNYGFKRLLNDSMISVADSIAEKYKNSINSVVYFFSLPYGLNDRAVNKEYIGESTILDKTYYKIKVWFDEDGGGKDHRDVFFYWIHPDKSTIEYLAYSYASDGGGLRFRKALDPRKISGIRVTDYLNYAPGETPVDLDTIERAFELGELQLLSIIDNFNVTISLLED